MAKAIIDLSGIGGLAPRFYGDLPFSASNSNSRIIAKPNQYAAGTVNPISRYGYVSPASNTWLEVTGSMAATAGSTQLDSINSKGYLYERGRSIWELESYSDSAAASIRTTGVGTTGTDLEIYTVNGSRKLFYSYKNSGGGNIGIYDLSSAWNDTWLSATVSGAFNTGATNDVKMVIADNGFMYVLDGNAVHKIDGTTDGGTNGTATANVLLFPSTFQLISAIDLRGKMWIALMRSTRDIHTATDAMFKEFCGVYVWDRLSSKANMTDFIPVEGAREIRTIFSFRGIPHMFTVSASKHAQLRAYNGNEFTVIAEMGISDYPEYDDSVVVVDDLIIWFASADRVYAYGKISPGEEDGLYKIGDANSLTGVGNVSTHGAVLFMGTTNNNVNNYITASPNFYVSLNSVIKKWTPYAAVLTSQDITPHVGSFRSIVKGLPRGSTVKSVTIYYPPLLSGNTGSTTALTVDLYFNQSNTSWGSTTITKDDAARAYKYILVGKSNVNQVQVGLTWNTSNTVLDSLTPSHMEIEYEEPGRDL